MAVLNGCDANYLCIFVSSKKGSEAGSCTE